VDPFSSGVLFFRELLKRHGLEGGDAD